MWKTISGDCPVHNEPIEIQIKYATLKQVGAQDQEGKVSYKCDKADLTNKICSSCPIYNNT